jgi:2-polyprenyl-6-hydroxyphenyl methylase/3-demethylubiquinone-9 3-methyltransferase
MDHIRYRSSVLELGCGYGRVLKFLKKKANLVIGIDAARASLDLAFPEFQNNHNCLLVEMNAVSLGFRNRVFDHVICIQNGISAFHVDQKKLIGETIRVTQRGGIILFSSYSSKIWPDRLEWFHIQSDAGLLGEIDENRTGNGIIVCKDGFTATTVTPDRFRSLLSDFSVETSIVEVDGSSLFCVITVP